MKHIGENGYDQNNVCPHLLTRADIDFFSRKGRLFFSLFERYFTEFFHEFFNLKRSFAGTCAFFLPEELRRL